MVVLGIDAHKSSHTIVAVDQNGSQLGKLTVQATSSGHLKALKWAEQWNERIWAIEDCRALSRLFETDLLRVGQAGVRVPPKLMSTHRRTIREQGKSDPIDARAVALAALREPDLPMIKLDGPEREIRLLIDHREALIAERTRVQNRIHLHVHELEPGLEIKPGSLDRIKVLSELTLCISRHHGTVAEITAELIERAMELTKRAKELESKITALVNPRATNLLDLVGCGPLTAAKIIGEVGSISRFRSQDAFGRHNGTAPIPVWSANNQNFRLDQGGNRQINAAIHRIATTQIQWSQQAKTYVAKKMASGMTKKMAKRALKRHISNQVYKRLMKDEAALSAAPRQPSSLAIAT